MIAQIVCQNSPMHPFALLFLDNTRFQVYQQLFTTLNLSPIEEFRAACSRVVVATPSIFRIAN